MSKMRRAVAATALAFGVALTALMAVPTQDQAFAAPGCSMSWGSLPKSGADLGLGEIKNLRGGRHHCYDRLVVDLQNATGRAGIWSATSPSPVSSVPETWNHFAVAPRFR